MERNGVYSVVYKNKSGSGSLVLWCHDDSPELSTERPYLGPLSKEELKWLKDKDNYSEDWDFSVVDQSKGTK